MTVVVVVRSSRIFRRILRFFIFDSLNILAHMGYSERLKEKRRVGEGIHRVRIHYIYIYIYIDVCVVCLYKRAACPYIYIMIIIVVSIRSNSWLVLYLDIDDLHNTDSSERMSFTHTRYSVVSCYFIVTVGVKLK